MKSYKLILIILVVFLKTGNVLSDTNIFDVNNIEVEKKGKSTNDALANQAIKKAFNNLIDKILLKSDREKVKELKFSEIKELVTYYQVINKIDDFNNESKVIYNILFDKDKIHDLFYKRQILYSEISNKELFVLPILKIKDQIFIYNKNYFYNNWNNTDEKELIEFILPLENIEIIENINSNKKNLINLELRKIFKEYLGKNLALILIEDKNSKEEKIYFKIKILEKKIVKNISIKRSGLEQEEFYKKIIIEVKKEITNLIKAQNLIDIRTPSFLNVQFRVNSQNSLAELNSRLKKIDSVENIYIKKFNNKSVFLKIKYLGKIEKIIQQMEKQKIILKLVNNEWSIKII